MVFNTKYLSNINYLLLAIYFIIFILINLILFFETSVTLYIGNTKVTMYYHLAVIIVFLILLYTVYFTNTKILSLTQTKAQPLVLLSILISLMFGIIIVVKCLISLSIFISVPEGVLEFRAIRLVRTATLEEKTLLYITYCSNLIQTVPDFELKNYISTKLNIIPSQLIRISYSNIPSFIDSLFSQYMHDYDILRQSHNTSYNKKIIVIIGMGLFTCAGIGYIIYNNPLKLLTKIKEVGELVLLNASNIKASCLEIQVLQQVVKSLQGQILNLIQMNPVINQTNGIIISHNIINTKILDLEEQIVLLKACCYKLVLFMAKTDEITLKEVKDILGPQITKLFF